MKKAEEQAQKGKKKIEKLEKQFQIQKMQTKQANTKLEGLSIAMEKLEMKLPLQIMESKAQVMAEIKSVAQDEEHTEGPAVKKRKEIP